MQKNITFVNFVRAGEKKDNQAEGLGILGTASDWQMTADIHQHMSFPAEIAELWQYHISHLVLKDAKNESASHRREDSEDKRKELRRKMTVEKRLAVTVSINIGFFLICYTPYAFIVIWKVLNTDAEIDPIAMAIPTMLTKIAGIENRVHPSIDGGPRTTVSHKEETPGVHSAKSKESNNSKHREDGHSEVAVYTVETSDIYEYQKESSFSKIIPKSLVDIADTINTESIIIVSDV
ncbi:unnamed protein product [Mytilus edulis]|uniref:Uncharacterized protein n=1 Tax=Mytilus edulis TaxID=6550 RepID=A0A8S3SAH5_MYTED|nr:unnamed protein product [Mytilus edulis]